MASSDSRGGRSPEFCRNCGQRLEQGVKFCVRCGTRVVPGGAPSRTETPEISVSPAEVKPRSFFTRRRLVYLGLTLGIIAVALILGFTLPSLFSGEPGEQATGETVPVTLSSSTTLVVTTTITSNVVSTTLAEVTSSTAARPTGPNYLQASRELAAALVTADERIPELAEQINTTAPNIPLSVKLELLDLRARIYVADTALTGMVAPSNHSAPDEHLQNASQAMKRRIDFTLAGVDAIVDSGRTSAGLESFDQGRQARDEYRAAFQRYQEALRGATPGTTTALIQQLRAAISRDVASFAFEILDYKVSGDWAGVIIHPTEEVTDDAPVLLKNKGEHWVAVNWGTGYTTENWLSEGAPMEIAEFLAEGS